MATYPKQQLQPHAAAPAFTDPYGKTVSEGPIGNGAFVRKVDVSAQAPSGGADGSRCTFCRRNANVGATYIVVQNPHRYLICSECATTIKTAVDSAAE